MRSKLKYEKSCAAKKIEIKSRFENTRPDRGITLEWI